MARIRLTPDLRPSVINPVMADDLVYFYNSEMSWKNNLVARLCSGEPQWIYCHHIHTQEQLWENFKYILEQNNKARLNDIPLSESEFAKIKNDFSHDSFVVSLRAIRGLAQKPLSTASRMAHFRW